MRTKHCVMCGTSLPEGVRSDRRYCREACRVMAYRQRHKPDPLREPALPNDDAVSANGTSSPKSAGQVSHSPDELPAALDHIADLDAQCRALRQRVTTLELQQETSQRRMATMELAIRRLRTTVNAPVTTPDPLPPATSESAQKANASDGVSALAMLPWMTSSTEDLSGQVPRWTLLTDGFITTLDTHVDRLLDNFPEVLMVLGLSSAATQIRQWQRNPTRTFRRVTRAIARRVVCTDKAARQGEPQMRDFVNLTVKSLSLPHPTEDTGDKAAWAQLLADGEKTLITITAFLLQKLQDADWMTHAS